jgi:Mg2+-importing ATPase
MPVRGCGDAGAAAPSPGARQGTDGRSRAARTAEALPSRIRHAAVALRDGRAQTVDVRPPSGDLVEFHLGGLVPVELR